MIYEILIGIILAVISVFAIAKIYPKKDHAFWRNGLVIAALVYVIFALLGGGLDYLPLEIGGLLLYGGFAYLSKKYALYWLAIGWALHIAWDIFLHSGTATAFVPTWYPGICLGFDMVLAVYVFWVYARGLK